MNLKLCLSLLFGCYQTIAAAPTGCATDQTVAPEGSCPPLKSIAYGSVLCPSGHSNGSICHFQCADQYQLLPLEISSTECLETKVWSHDIPCCASVNCETEAVMDTAIVLDASSSIGYENWKWSKKLVSAILRLFPVGRNTSRYSILQYNDDVNLDTLIHFNDHFNQEDLLAAFDKMYYPTVHSTMTGKALKFVNDVVMAEENGCRRDVPHNILLFSDGEPADDTKEIAEQLKKKFNVITIAIMNLRKWSHKIMQKMELLRWERAESRLRYIASDESSFFKYQSYSDMIDEISFLKDVMDDELSIGDFEGVTKDILLQVKKIACTAHCA